MKILVHHHKYGDVYYDATDELWAFGEMFKELEEFSAYLDIEDGNEKEQEELYEKAKAGDLDAARGLCRLRKQY